MYIQKLTLQNFKCFDNIDIEFHPNLTVIVGENGSGKTSIMEGAAIAVSTMFVKMDGLSARSIDKGQAHLKAFSIGSTKDVQPQYPVTVKASAVTKSETIHWARSLNRPEGKMAVVNAKKMINLGISFQEHLRNGDASLILPVIAYLQWKLVTRELLASKMLRCSTIWEQRNWRLSTEMSQAG